MKLIPSEFDEYNPLVMMRGPLMVWLPHGIFGPLFAIGLIILMKGSSFGKKGSGSV